MRSWPPSKLPAMAKWIGSKRLKTTLLFISPLGRLLRKPMRPPKTNFLDDCRVEVTWSKPIDR